MPDPLPSFAIPVPFNIAIDPMERLLLVNFENDLDDVYKGFEPQVFDDEVHGKGHLVIGWRVDGRVDVYHQRSLKPDAAAYDITGHGLANMVPTDFEAARFEVKEAGIDAKYAFNDQLRRPIIIRIKESKARLRKPFGLLAPMGAAAERPQALPLILLHDFYFVRKGGTRVNLSIDGRTHRIDSLPFPIDFTRMHFARYSPKPLIAMLNTAREGAVPVVDAPTQEATEAAWNNTRLALTWDKGHPELAALIEPHAVHPVTLRFDPPFPNLLHLEADTVLKGLFAVSADPSTGEVGGDYEVQRSGQLITLAMTPSGGWRPRPDKWSLRVLYTVAGMFKNWPKTYRWDAQVQVQPDGSLTMVSGWKRTGRS